MHYFVSEIVV